MNKLTGSRLGEMSLEGLSIHDGRGRLGDLLRQWLRMKDEGTMLHIRRYYGLISHFCCK